MNKNLFKSSDDVINSLLTNCDYNDVKNNSLGKLIKDIIEELNFR